MILSISLLEKLLKQQRCDDIKIITSSYLDIKKQLATYRQKYDLLAVVGSIDPAINLPYFPMAKLLSPDFQQEFLRLIDTAYLPEAPPAPEKSIYEKAKDLLEQYVKYSNPKLSITQMKKTIEAIGYVPENQERILDLIIHMGCMLDRCMHHDAILFENTRQYKQKYQTDFERIRCAIDQLEAEYDIKINDDEVCYIVKIIKMRK